MATEQLTVKVDINAPEIINRVEDAKRAVELLALFADEACGPGRFTDLHDEAVALVEKLTGRPCSEVADEVYERSKVT